MKLIQSLAISFVLVVGAPMLAHAKAGYSSTYMHNVKDCPDPSGTPVTCPGYVTVKPVKPTKTRAGVEERLYSVQHVLNSRGLIITIIDPNGKSTTLPPLPAYGFKTFAYWYGDTEARTVDSVLFVFDVRADPNPIAPQQKLSTALVKLSGQVCFVDVRNYTLNNEAQVRKIAHTAPSMPCLTEVPK